MSVFEPEVVLNILKKLEPPGKQKKFVTDWKETVDKRVKSWKTNRTSAHQTCHENQLEWEANITVYVSFLNSKTRATKHGATPLPSDIPLLGPRFLPPTYLHLSRRKPSYAITPNTLYMRPLNDVVHPFYYPQLANCPRCLSTDITWDGWTGQGSRDVHGIQCEETAIGFQLRCKQCKEYEKTNDKRGTHCVATTNPDFWEKFEHWQVPRGIPHFFKRCAITRDLFDLLIETRPSTTSGGLAGNIKQMHLLDYKKRHLEYLQFYLSRGPTPLQPVALQAFSEPYNIDGFDDESITDDMITEILLVYHEKTRQEESAEYARTLTGVVLSLDHTFGAADKASIATKTGERTKPMKGGLLNVINENSEYLAWQFCQSQSSEEIRECLGGLRRRYEELGVAPPEMIVVDNCCHVRRAINNAFPAAAVVLDVHHLLGRYTGAILNGKNNPNRQAIASDITGAILKVRAANSPSGMAEYWDKDEQVRRLQAAFDKWEKRGAWNASGLNVHLEQMKHAMRGCLARTRQDVRSDGSRIEGSHKGWNSLQRSFASGIEVMTALGSDFVLRRNVRIGSKDSHPTTPFLRSTFGSHHTRLVSATAKQHNDLIAANIRVNGHVATLPELPTVLSGEKFGIVKSEHASTFAGLFTIKDEESDSEDANLTTVQVDQPEVERAIPDQTKNEEPIDIDVVPVADVVLVAEVAPVAAICTTRTPQLAEGSSVSLKRKSSPVAGEDLQETNDATNKKPRVDSENPHLAHPFFALHSRPAPKVVPPPSFKPASISTAVTAATVSLASSLPLPQVAVGAPRLSRSERLFALHTGVNPKSISIGIDSEYFLFMRMRKEKQWVSFNMNPRKWVQAAHSYNAQLEFVSPMAVPKLPSALQEKLAEVEKIIHDRISRDDYPFPCCSIPLSFFRSAKASGTDVFWKEHCMAVPLVKMGTENKKRKPQTCNRCHTIMYPGPTGSSENHKRGVCSDGVRQTAKSIPWPQPQGIFDNGAEFRPIAFLQKLREVYEDIVVQGQQREDVPMEYQAFTALLSAQTVDEGGALLFNLACIDDALIFAAAPDEFFVKDDSGKLTHLRLDCLRDTN